MKTLSGTIITILFIMVLMVSGCKGDGTSKKNKQGGSESGAVADTGYTGIKQYMSGQKLVKEVTFKNGVREGLMKSFYQSGEVRQTFWYSNGLREDSAKWYYLDGPVFRSTPYRHDTVDGIQKQYYRNGRIKAKLGYKNGMRTSYIEEYTMEGKLVSGYPQLIVNTQDEYKLKGVFKITLKLSDNSTKVKFYIGDMSNGVFDTIRCKKIDTIKGAGYIDLRKTGSPRTEYIGVIAEALTNFGNNYLIYKKIDLPYNDLK